LFFANNLYYLIRLIGKRPGHYRQQTDDDDEDDDEIKVVILINIFYIINQFVFSD